MTRKVISARMRHGVAWVMIIALLVICFSFAGAEENRVVINMTRATFNLPESDPAQVKKVEDAINAYIADKMNVEIRLTDVGSDHYSTSIREALAEGSVNLLWTASWEPLIGTNDLVATHQVYDITDLLPGTPLYGSMSKNIWTATMYEDRNYFIPVYKDNVEGYDFMFRQDLAEKYHWDISSISSLFDLEPLLEDGKREGLKYPFLTQNTSMFYRWYIDQFDFFTSDVTTNFFAIDRKTDTVIDTILTPEYAEFCKLMGAWAEKGYISKDEVDRITTDTTTQTQDWGISWWTDIPVNMEASSRYRQGVIVKSATGRYAHRTSSLGSCYCVTAYSTPQQAQASVDFLGLLYTDKKLADIFTFGIEGEDFEYTQTGDQAFPHVTQHSELYNHSMWESASAMIVTPLANEPDNKPNLYIDFNGGANIPPSYSFRFDRRPVMEKYTACQNLFDSYGFVLENGGVPENEVEARIQEYQVALDEAGYQEVLAEFQRQYDVWKGNK